MGNCEKCDKDARSALALALNEFVLDDSNRENLKAAFGITAPSSKVQIVLGSMDESFSDILDRSDLGNCLVAMLDGGQLTFFRLTEFRTAP